MILFSNNLRVRRKKRKLSLRDVAKATGVSYAALSRLERGLGLMEMSAGRAQVLAKFFGWDIKEMLRLIRSEASRKEKACGKSR